MKKNTYREFKANGKRYVIVESNNTMMGKWQAMVFSTHYNAWTQRKSKRI